MLQKIMSTTYSTAEAAAATEHGSFADFRRNMVRDDMAVLPRKSQVGRGGGDYEYAHIIEMALHIPVAAQYSRETAKQFTAGLFRLICQQIFNTRDFQEKYQFLAARRDEYETDKYQMADYVNGPAVFFNEDIISRDENNRTWAIFMPGITAQTGGSISLVNEITRDTKGKETSLTFAGLRAKAESLALDGATDERSKYSFIRSAWSPGILDLTGIFTRVEDILQFRINAREAGRAI